MSRIFRTFSLVQSVIPTFPPIRSVLNIPAWNHQFEGTRLAEMSEAPTTNFFIQSGSNFIVQFNGAATISSTMMRHSHILQTNDINLIMSSRQATFAFIVTVLLNFLQVKYQGKDQSPFETRPKAMFGATIGLLVYCLLYDANLKLSAINNHISRSTSFYAYFLKFSLAFFGPLSLASISSILFPESLCPLLFSLSIFFSICKLSQSQIIRIWNWLRGQLRQEGTRRGGVVSVELPWFPEHVYMDQADVLPPV